MNRFLKSYSFASPSGEWLRRTASTLMSCRVRFHAVIGPNGAGKTTFVAQIAGMLKSDSGTITFDGRDMAGKTAPEALAYGARTIVPDHQRVPRFHSALENVSLSIQAHAGHSFRFWKRASTDRDLTDPAQKILDDVGLGDKALTLAGNLAHGQQRQLEIAMALATSPKIAAAR